jgi:hypothetical protein
MDQVKLSGFIGAQPNGTFFINDMKFLNWGQEIRFNCRYVPPESGDVVYFDMRLKDCRDLQWRVYAHISLAEDLTPPPTAIVNLRLGTSQHHKPLQMLTDAFAITVMYGELLIQKM